MRMIDERLCRLEHSQNEAELAGLTAAVVQHS
jgi:hypothetical protein